MGLGLALKIGGRVVGSIVKKAKAKRAETRFKRKQEKAAKAEAETSALFSKLGYTRSNSSGGGQSPTNERDGGVLDKKIPDTPKKVAGKNFPVMVIVAALLAFVFLFTKMK